MDLCKASNHSFLVGVLLVSLVLFYRISNAAAPLVPLNRIDPKTDVTPRPKTTSGFSCVSSASSFEKAIISGVENILIAQGKYIVRNPLVIDRPGILFLMGAGRLRTKLMASDSSKPLFIVRRIDRLSLAGLELSFEAGDSDVPLLEALNQKPAILEIQDCFLRGGCLMLKGKGRIIVQGSHFDGLGRSRSAMAQHGILIDNPEAELYVVAGNMSHCASSHILQKSGHVEVYGTGMQHQGTADIVLQAPSPKGAHIIAAVRSEGTNTLSPSTFLLVPKSEKPVDVVLKANNFTSPRFAPPGTPPCSLPVAPNIFADYNAKGHLWLIGNFCHANTRHLVFCSSPGAKIIAIGNAIKGCINPLNPLPSMFVVPEGAKLWSAYNVFDYEAVSGKHDFPLRRFADPAQEFKDLPDMPLPPDNAGKGKIPRLGRPQITIPPPKEFLRCVTDFASDPACRDAGDDTCYLQKALDSEGARVYIPAGTYRISRPLRLNQVKAKGGGMIAGAGSKLTHIISSARSAFISDGMAYVTIQGITFETTNQKGAVVDLEWPDQLGKSPNPYVATQANNFYDVHFKGGKYGLGIGLLSGRQCSENLVVNSTFSNTHVGLAVGHYNALANTLHGVHFVDTDWNVGFSDETSGGTWAIFEGEAKGTKEGILYRPSLGRNLYHNNFRSDGPQLLSIGWNSNETIIFFDHCQFKPRVRKKLFLDFNAGLGVIFSRSLVTFGHMHVGGNGASSFVISYLSSLNNIEVTTDYGNCSIGVPDSISRKNCIARFDEIRPGNSE